ncbi:hypothetical protein ABFS82_11G121000 [Erythranthe guttata]|uniref:chorismate mutase n=1 Tax=Erythranthe guttata TaxID=4155 RepID=A0A022R6Y3_ERYGU|nr:PREDICTED: chorismate mutase 1, chloroplastic-like [Erythranthe guttata]XP_012840609.1 PREDICTED: chorismate mutase 1, chloroplastic-like [Erythranthe guttata]EYU34630.1 hypothetical protein MIMGU_mgv1a010033mg [Erythranthe guttata]|eukprot:XP_012840608.1 PREDICTED: chorismate mutase 1, chloroplastic-like [Erythranthe guttata]
MEAKLLGGAAAASSAVLSPSGYKISRPSCPFARQTYYGLRLPNLAAPKNGIFAINGSTSAVGSASEKRVDETDRYTLEGIRSSLIRQEDSIIFSFVERSQFCYNPETYDPNLIDTNDFRGSLVEFMVRKTEKIHAKAGRYKSPDEHPFFPDNLPEPILPPLEYPKVLHRTADSININDQVWDMYFKNLLPRFVRQGDDGNCGSAAMYDTICLQTLSKRIHYGKFVAEAKFLAAPDVYEAAIRAQDGAQLMDLLTYPEVEKAIEKRVEIKTRNYGRDLVVNGHEDDSTSDPVYKINPSVVAELYGKWIMPLTKQVQVQYLLTRLD